MENIETLIATGFKGHLDSLGVQAIKAYADRDARIRAGELKGFPQLTPEYTGNLEQEVVLLGTADPTELLKKHYSQQVEDGQYIPGPFGDFMKIAKFEGNYILTTMAPKAFEKPGLASDLGVVIKGKGEKNLDQILMITGVRKQDPGKGELAWLGGFRDVAYDENGIQQLDSAIYTAIKEGKEEAFLQILPQGKNSIQSLRYAYDATSLPIDFRLGNNNFNGTMHYLKTINTSDLYLSEGGELLTDHRKRVHATSGYLCLVDAEDLSTSSLIGELKAGDDIGDLKFTDVTDIVANPSSTVNPDIIKFGIQHHQEFLEPMLIRASQELGYRR